MTTAVILVQGNAWSLSLVITATTILSALFPTFNFGGCLDNSNYPLKVLPILKLVYLCVDPSESFIPQISWSALD